MLLCTAVWSTIATAKTADKKPSTVADLRYGVTLYHYYQQNYFAALSELMVAQSRGGIVGHGDNPQLIVGSIGLAFGMEQQAGNLFTQLLDQNKPQTVRDIAWYYLGKLQYQQGQWARAQSSFAQISAELDRQLVGELESMRVQILLRSEQFKEAQQYFAKLPAAGAWSELSNFNMGVSYGKLGNSLAAQQHFQRVTQAPLRSNAQAQKLQRALKDRAYTASGYVHIQQGEYQNAVNQFERVRLQGPYSDRAMLGLGWAYSRLNNYQKALQPWTQLKSASLQLTSVQEVQLATAYAYEQLDADNAALQAYLDAESVYSAELQKIDQVQVALQGRWLLGVITASDPKTNHNWIALNANSALKPEQAYLSELFAHNAFQARVQAIRDLLFLRSTLQQWQIKQASYAELLIQRQRLREEKLMRINASGLLTQHADLQRKATALSQWLKQVETDKNYLALASSEELLENLEIVEAGLSNIAQLEKKGESVDFEKAQLKFYRGVLLWRASENFSENLWAQKRSLEQLNHQLSQLVETQKSLQFAIDQAPEIIPYQQRMAVLDGDIESRLAEIEAQLVQQESALRQQVETSLTHQRGRIKRYMARARLAIARLYDERLQQ